MMRSIHADRFTYKGLVCNIHVFYDDEGNIKTQISLDQNPTIGTTATIPSLMVNDIEYDRTHSLGDLIDLALRGCSQCTKEMIDVLLKQGKL